MSIQVQSPISNGETIGSIAGGMIDLVNPASGDPLAAIQPPGLKVIDRVCSNV